MMKTTSETITRQLYEFFTEGDITGMLSVIDPNCKFSFPGSPEIIPWAGEYHGHGFTKLLDICASTIEFKEFRVHTYYSQGDVTTVLGVEECLVKATGKIFKNNFAGIVIVKNEKIVDYKEFHDTATIQAAFM